MVPYKNFGVNLRCFIRLSSVNVDYPHSIILIIGVLIIFMLLFELYGIVCNRYGVVVFCCILRCVQVLSAFIISILFIYYALTHEKSQGPKYDIQVNLY